ncbi:flagellar hook-associated protein FlgK [Thermocrinis albus DSM 14484]|uniref:Flagellar hook-associated protein 1 n=1 Tax=Thermocrinis albus (strain DSM 14484 / JCM 11386 / HI 11/12) TaxID=638303 RepID=D3SLV0_THEAH|nr:flagellar hook-associated protein FlgK [Thermocrinis albus]ADC89730.1 flagellar hook-associated protein FlgK [Thermocrinis albus DSM 14484]
MLGATFGIVSQGLQILRKAIEIRNRNVLNASNPDYAQENPRIESFAPVGIKLEDVERVRNFYLLSERNNRLSVVNYLEERIKKGEAVEDLFQEFTGGVGGAEYINNFFRAFQDLMKDPTNVGARADLVRQANTLMGYIRDRKGDMDRVFNSTVYNLQRYVGRVNELTQKLAQINRDILTTYARTYSSGKDYKNLLDERDRLLRELSELINVRVQEDDIGRVRVEMAGGFLLVEEGRSWTITYDASSRKVFWNSKDGSTVDVTGHINGGRIKGAVEFLKDLDLYLQGLDNVAKRLISRVKLPVIKGSDQYYWTTVKNSPGDPIGESGSITLVGVSSVTVSYQPSDTLQDIANIINAQNAGFTASVVQEPDGTYTLRIVSSDPSYQITDSNGNIGVKVFTGTGLQDGGVNPQLPSLMGNLDYSVADRFFSLSSRWWEDLKDLYQKLVSDISSTQNTLKKQHEIEKALLDSLNARLSELQGVSIDQEFMEIMQLQRSYEALAKTVSAMDDLLRTTLNMV